MIGLVSAVFDEVLAEFVILPMDEALFNWSFELVLDDDFRILDSLQLAAAFAFSADRSDVRFVCADTNLISVAWSQGLDAVNPVEE